jgi:hypothetical protein
VENRNASNGELMNESGKFTRREIRAQRGAARQQIKFRKQEVFEY